ncbi:ZIP family metal transporter [Candidatus Pacearchaeota archaeon]|nr:ZIP family metal transporter [Candidatus Pacearchaeota archaeon]
METLLYILISIGIISLLSLIGVFTLALKKGSFEKIILFLVSLSAGALFGAAILHLLPEAISNNGLTMGVALYFLSGILAFFILEKFIAWRHCHIKTSREHPHKLGIMNLVGDGVHNLIDGMIVAGSYLISIPLGISTTIGIILHEIPQEISDFGVLLYAKFSKKKALFFNFISACFAFIGAFLAFFLGASIEGFSIFLIAFAAGGFVYIAGSDLIPELHKETKIKKSLMQLFGILLGIALMVLAKFIE